jgi:hypothetical protein
MKPERAARRADYEIRRAEHSEVAALIRKHHYAKGCANTSSECFGAFRDGGLVAGALWMPPTKGCAMTVASDWRRVLCLSRLAVVPGEPTNVASMLIGACVRAFRRERRWVALVTYADVWQAHTGVIYRATNWTYEGLTEPQPKWLGPDGQQVSRLSTKSRTTDGMRALGYRMAGKYSKHKFVMNLQAA